MFLECPTAQKFQLGPDKLKYVINWGLTPHFKDLLKTKLQNSEFLLIFFDESLNKSLKTAKWILESVSGVKKQNRPK